MVTGCGDSHSLPLLFDAFAQPSQVPPALHRNVQRWKRSSHTKISEATQMAEISLANSSRRRSAKMELLLR